jgi:hypothetical protein
MVMASMVTLQTTSHRDRASGAQYSGCVTDVLSSGRQA